MNYAYAEKKHTEQKEKENCINVHKIQQGHK